MCVTPQRAHHPTAVSQSPHLLPCFLAGFSSSTSLFQLWRLRTRRPPRAAASPPILCRTFGPLVWRKGYGWGGCRLSLVSLHPKGGRISIPQPPALFMSGRFAGCWRADTALESKPSPGGRSTSRRNIYSRANPGGDGMHPALLGRGEALLALLFSRVTACCRHLSHSHQGPVGSWCLPGSAGQRSGSSAGGELKQVPAEGGSWG